MKKDIHEKVKNNLQPVNKIWWQTPKLKDDSSNEHERKATWLELFFDLIFVAAIATLAHELAHELEHHPTWKVIVTYVFLFIPIWWVWIGNTFYNERFHVNDIGHRLFTLIQMIGVAGLAYFAQGGLDEITTKGFAACYSFCRIIIVLLWWRGAIHNKAVRKLVRIITSGFSFSILLFIISIFVDPPVRFILWGIGLFVDLVIPFLSSKQLRNLSKQNEDYIRERFGLFTIIVLGESVAGAVAGAANAQNLTIQTAIAGILGLVLSFGLWFIYFDQTMNSQIKNNRFAKSAWYYFHLPLMMALTGIGAGVLAVVGSHDYQLSSSISWLLCGSTALAFVMFGLIELLSEGWVDDMAMDYTIIFKRFLFAGLALLVGYYGPHLNSIITISLLLLMVIYQSVYGLIIWVKAVKAHDGDYKHGWSK